MSIYDFYNKIIPIINYGNNSKENYVYGTNKFMKQDLWNFGIQYLYFKADFPLFSLYSSFRLTGEWLSGAFHSLPGYLGVLKVVLSGDRPAQEWPQVCYPRRVDLPSHYLHGLWANSDGSALRPQGAPPATAGLSCRLVRALHGEKGLGWNVSSPPFVGCHGGSFHVGGRLRVFETS